jgi:periplasmic protein TonB
MNMPKPRLLPPASEPWERSGRYTDQPTSLGARLFGVGGIAFVVAVAAAAMLLTWTRYTAARPPESLHLFDVAPPAAPPEPERETPPGPEQVQREKPQPKLDQPAIDPPKVVIPSDNPMPIAAPEPAVDPGPPAKETTAPESRPAPPAAQSSDAKPSWQGQVLAALNRVKRYPREAAFRRQTGVPYIRFAMDREGRVLSATLERSSGVRALDAEALALPKRAQPLPKPPEEVAGARIELVVPVEFFMR